MGLRGRLTLVIALLAALATVAVAVAAVQTTRRALEAELDRSLAAVARVADDGRGRGMHAGALPPMLRAAQPLVAQLHAPDDTVTLLAGATAVPVRDAVLGAARAGEVRVFTTALDGTPYRALARPAAQRGVLVVATDAGDQARVLAALVRRISLIGLVVVAGAAAAAWFAAGALIGPLRRLTAAAEHVSRTGDLDVAVGTDASDEAGRLSRAFAGMLAALGASQAQQQQLVDDAGHELRTPIASIRSNAEVLKRHPTLEPDMRARIADDLIGESAELTTMVNALVELAGVTASAEQPEAVEVVDVVRAAVGRLPPDDRGRVQVSGTASAVLRPTQLQRAVVNLLTNAAKFDPSGAPIEVQVSRDAAGVQVSVRDHGPGIAPADQPHVFARFYRAESARSVPGSGLGLAIVADIARRNAGSVQASTHPAGGAVLTLRLPG